MKLLRVALAGLLGLAGLTVGASNNKAHVAHTLPKDIKTRGTTWDNDLSGKYM
jgi:hypothetical protein